MDQKINQNSGIGIMSIKYVCVEKLKGHGNACKNSLFYFQIMNIQHMGEFG